MPKLYASRVHRQCVNRGTYHDLSPRYAFVARRRTIVDGLASGFRRRVSGAGFQAPGVSVEEGFGSFSGEDVVEPSIELLNVGRFDAIAVAFGTLGAKLARELAEQAFWLSRS
ncbi:MAG: hypothetical protein VBE63_07340 [Lamprobacter sp.]|uniref:hypothetical protein n=1 Tax=Lamprobacter sp. TaxID=3100796 RepID=UPI002B26158B|nr:hypothetical protein [Lamprobacter sp.]MEA3639742.1 hypothetical protein [Lamprobacter sp.]